MNADNKKRFANNIGNEYELFRKAVPHHDNIQEGVISILKNHLASMPETKVLEIGFGTGITSAQILDSDKNINLTAVDNEVSMLRKAEAALSAFNGRFDLEIEDGLKFLRQQNAETFDAVISVWVIHNFDFEYRNEFLKELYRILKPGGIFINGDKIAVDDFVEHEKHLYWQMKQFDIYEDLGKPEIKNEWVQHYLEDEKPNKILYEREFKNILESLGFKNYKLRNRNFMDAVVSVIK